MTSFETMDSSPKTVPARTEQRESKGAVADRCDEFVRWLPARELADTARGRLARLAIAQAESFAGPAELIKPDDAKTGAMAPVLVATAEPPASGSTPMTPAAMRAESHEEDAGGDEPQAEQAEQHEDL